MSEKPKYLNLIPGQKYEIRFINPPKFQGFSLRLNMQELDNVEWDGLVEETLLYYDPDKVKEK